MVRTRANRIKPDSQDDASKESQDSAYCSPTLEERPKRLVVVDIKRQAQEKIRKLEDSHRSLLDDIEKHYDMMRMSIGPYFCSMLLSDFVKEETVRPGREYESFVETKTVASSSRGFATSTVRKKERESPPSPQVTRVTRQSRLRSTLRRSISENNISMIAAESVATTVKKHTRRTRSASINRQTSVITKSIYETPSTNHRTLTAVTPKADPATAALKRYPRHGEFALSLTGSPLMVAATSAEANITLPLNNGDVYSVSATDNFIPGNIPALSSNTRKQILLLRKNLDRLLAK